MVLHRDEILNTLGTDGARLRQLGVKRLALFGSGARGGLRDDSDLDFVLELRHKTFDAYMDVKEFLEERFGRRVDLVLDSALRPELRDQILREAIDAPLG